MSREIKFRAYNKVDKTMYTDAVNNCKDTFDMILKHPQIYEVLQCTGLKDCKGVEIFEGDILQSPKRLHRVIYHDGCYYADAINKPKGMISLKAFIWNSTVIGNIYEHSHLLEGENQ